MLVTLLPELSRTRIQALIKAGAVRLDGAAVIKPGQLLTGERVLEVDEAPANSPVMTPELEGELRILHADDDLVAVDKPAGVLTHSNTPGGELGIAEILDRRFGPFPSQEGRRPGVAHRLDRETSGVLLLGRNERALAALKTGFHDRVIEKTYVAIVRGDPRFDTEWIDAELGRHPNARDRISIVPAGEGRDASTYYEVRERFGEFARLDVFPKTGRTHQVRVHLAHVGLPLLGDELYVPKRRKMPELPADAPQVTRHALHASRLKFTHPTTGAPMDLEAPLPRELADVLEWLRARKKA